MADRVDGRLNFDTKINTKGFSKGIGSLKGLLDGLKSAVLKTSAAVAALVASSAKLAAMSAEVNAANSAMSQTFKEFEAQAREAIRSVAKESGILETRLQSAATSIYAFAKTSGMDSVTALGMMQEALQVAADQAAYYDKSLEESSESLKAFLKGNYANDAALGVSCTETTRNAVANKMYAKSFADLSEAQKQLALLQMVKDANDLSGATGQAAREAEGWENVTGNLKEAWRQLLAVVGQPVLSLAVGVVKDMTAALTELTEQARSAVSALSEVFGIQLMNTTDEVAQAADNSAGSYSDMAESAEDAAEANETSLASFDKMTKLSSTDNSGSSTAASGVLPNTEAATADIETGEAEKKLKAFFSGVKTEFERLFQPLQNAWASKGQGVLDSAKQSFLELRGLAGDVGGSMAEVWTNGTGQDMSEHILGIWTNINGIIGGLTGSFRRAWNEDSLGTSLIQSFADVANTALGHLETLTGKVAEWSQDVNFEPVLTSIKSVSDALQPLVDLGGEGAEWVWDNIISKIGSWTIEEAVPAALNTISAGLVFLTAAAKKLKKPGKWLWDNFLEPMMDFSGAVVIGFLEDLTDLLTDLTDLLNGSTSLSDFTGQLNSMQVAMLTFAGIFTGEKVIKGISGIASTLKTLKAPAWISGIAGFVTKYLVPLGKNILAWLSFDVPEILSLGLQGIFVTITSAVAAFFAGWKIGTYLKGILDEFLDFQDAFNVGMDMIAGFAQNAVEEIVGFFAGLWDSFKIGGEMIGQFISQDIPAFFSDAKESVVQIWRNIGLWFKNRWTDIKDVFKSVGSWFKEKFQEGWSGIVSVFTGTGAWFGARWQDVKNIFGGIKSWFKEKFESAYSGITEAFSGIGDFFGGIWENISSGAKGAVNLVIDALNSMIRGINKISFDMPTWDWLPENVQGMKFGISIPEIPRLAQGPVVPANYGEFMAVLGDNKRETEVVSPLSTIRQAVMEALVALGDTGGGRKISITIPVQIDKKTITRIVIDDINDYIRKTGKSPIKV